MAEDVHAEAREVNNTAWVGGSMDEKREAEIRVFEEAADKAWAEAKKWQELLVTAEKERDEAHNRISHLEAALRKYVSHQMDCAAYEGMSPTGKECTCGFDAALAGGKE